MRSLSTGLLLVALAAPSGAAVWATARGAPTSPPPPWAADELEDEYEELVDAFEEAQTQWYEKLRSAPESEQRAIYENENPAPDFVPKFQSLGERAGTAPVAAKAWLWVFSNASEKKDKLDALEVLVADHIGSPALDELCSSLGFAYQLERQSVQSALETIAAESPHREVQASAWFQLASLLSDRGEKDKALEAARKVATDYAGSKAAASASGLLYELEKLQVGMLAPDFEAVDQVGVSFKLSDYRGKVVLLDFWGFW